MPDIDRVLQDLRALDDLRPADTSRVLPELEHARARLSLALLRLVSTAELRNPAAAAAGLLTVKKVPQHLRFSPRHIYELVRGGRLRVARNGRAIRISRDALAEWQRMPSLDNICSWISC